MRWRCVLPPRSATAPPPTRSAAGPHAGRQPATLSARCRRFRAQQKEKQLEELTQEKEGLEAEVLTARQLSARGGGAPQIVEIHHHNDLSDDDDEAPAPA
jgi:hypothetical protein